MKNFRIYTDGACRNNGKPDAVGGWGFCVFNDDGENIHEDFGSGDIGTTNNKMELQSVIHALRYIEIHMSYDVETYKINTDSTYVYNGITQWIYGWISKGWKDVKNVELWKELYNLTKDKTIEWEWVKAHNGTFGNEQADYLANKGCDLIEKGYHVKPPLQGKSKKEIFEFSMCNVYAVNKFASDELFNVYSRLKEDEHDLNSKTNLLFLSIMSGEDDQ